MPCAGRRSPPPLWVVVALEMLAPEVDAPSELRGLLVHCAELALVDQVAMGTRLAGELDTLVEADETDAILDFPWVLVEPRNSLGVSCSTGITAPYGRPGTESGFALQARGEILRPVPLAALGTPQRARTAVLLPGSGERGTVRR